MKVEVDHQQEKQLLELLLVLLHKRFLAYDKIIFSTYVERIYNIQSPEIDELPSREQIESSPTRCPHAEMHLRWKNVF